MKLKKYIYAILAASLIAFTAQSCFQDMEQSPAFDYPEEPPKPPVNENGQILYMSFDDNYTDAASNTGATKVGNAGFAEGKVGKAYAGATDSYLTFRTSDLVASLGSDLTISFWYNVNADPDRSGIIVIGPATEGASPEAQNNRTSGIRIFRENVGGKQRIKVNVGDGTADGWLDNAKADLDPATAGWKYIALTLTKGEAILYVDAEEAATCDLTEISWNGCDIISIGSGAPRFTEWNHLSDNSLIDELRIYDRALTSTQIREIIIAETEE
jgi:hypothetical protein